MSAVSAALRKLKRRKFKSHAAACTPRKITFRANGRTKSFTGRPGGAGKNGICGRPTAGVMRARAAFRKAVRGCPKTNGKSKFACIKRKLKG